MKKSFFGLVFLLGSVFYLSSCSETSLSPDDSDAAIIDMLFLATTNDSTAGHRHHGRCNVTEIAVTDLSTTITDYIAANYAGATVVRAGSNDSTGNIMVAITLADASKLGLLFDSAGTFIQELVKKGRGTVIESSALPTATTDYISANYSTATISKSILETDGTYKVILVLEDSTYLGLSFDANGAFVAEVAVRGKDGRKHGKGGKRG